MNTPALRYAILELSLRCNLRCAHCASAAGKPRPEELSFNEWREVIADLADLACPSVDLMGGEVLMSSLLDPVGRALQEADIAWGLLTNGWMLDEARARQLVERGCRGVGVSLDGACADTHDTLRGRAGSFERALAAIEVVASLPFKERNRTVLTSVHAGNIDELEAMGALLSNRARSFRWQINLCSASGSRMPEAARLQAAQVDKVVTFLRSARASGRFELHVTGAHDIGYFVDDDQLHDHDWEGCPAGVHNVGIQSDGLIKGCLALDASAAVGSVREQGGLRAIWQDAVRMAPYRDFDVGQLGPQCARCAWGSLCKGGCRAYSKARTGRPHNHPHCLWRIATDDRKRRTARPVLSHRREQPWEQPLRSACIELTLRCNLRCRHCGSTAGSARNRELALEDFVPLFGDLHRLGCERVVLLGGEPLLHPDWEAIATMARGFDLNVALITNGVGVTPDVARRLEPLVTHVGVSIDGATDATHDWLRGVPGARAKAWRGLDRLSALSIPVTVITTLSRANVHELGAMRDQLIGRSLVWQLQAANGTGARFRNNDMLDAAALLDVARFIQQTRQSIPREQLAIAGAHNLGYHACTIRDIGAVGSWQGCPGGITSLGICSDGSIKGCLSMDACETVGSIEETPLYELWRDPRTFARARVTRPGRLDGGCTACPHGAKCRAGCPAMARTATGDVWSNPLCIRQAERNEALA
jgi:radical SAM protein with 4Fe4S-binding SPASM domain